MFVDNVKIHVKAGNGGNGAVTFRREKYIDSGGPDGGDGGAGGNIVFKVASNVNTLLNFRYQKKIVASNGENGSKRNCTGKSAEDLIVYVPQGTIVKKEDGKMIADLSKPDDEYIIAHGGKGGKGNAHFATSVRQAPRFAEQGEEGEEFELDLELKLIADVGLIGFPNAGKSSIISRVSDAKVKIANYPFTTLEPSLGVVRTKSGQTFVFADIPGIIEGASEGVGLGIEFLRHVERTRLLLHVVDVSMLNGREPLEDYKCVRQEIQKYSEKLAKLPELVVANKIDVMQDNSGLEKLAKYLKEKNIPVIEVSAVSGENMLELIEMAYNKLSVQVENIEENESDFEEITLDGIVKVKDDISIDIVNKEYVVSGTRIERMMKRVNVEDIESRQYMMRSLKSMGVIELLVKKGIKNGDTVSILDFKFIYQE